MGFIVFGFMLFVLFFTVVLSLAADEKYGVESKPERSESGGGIHSIQKDLIMIEYGYTPRSLKEDNIKLFGNDRADELEKELRDWARDRRDSRRKIKRNTCSDVKNPINGVNGMYNDDSII